MTSKANLNRWLKYQAVLTELSYSSYNSDGHTCIWIHESIAFLAAARVMQSKLVLCAFPFKQIGDTLCHRTTALTTGGIPEVLWKEQWWLAWSPVVLLNKHVLLFATVSKNNTKESCCGFFYFLAKEKCL